MALCDLKLHESLRRAIEEIYLLPVTCIVFSDTKLRDFQPESSNLIRTEKRSTAMTNPTTKYIEEYRRESADYIISTGRFTTAVAGKR